MDKLEDWEVLEIIDNLKFADAAHWEMTRLLLSCYADKKKVKKITDIMQFPWDEGYVELKNTISNEEIEEMKAKIGEISKNMRRQ